MPSALPHSCANRLCLSAIALLLNLPLVHAQVVSVPKVVVDAEIGHALTAAGSPVRLANPAGVATAPDGTVYVADSSNNRIVKISSDGAIGEKPATRVARIAATATFLEPSEGLSRPNAVAVAPDGTLYFSDAVKKTLYRVTNPESNSPVYTQLTYAATQAPSALAVDPSGNLWVADASRKEIIEFAANAMTATKAASVSPMEPTGLAVSGSSLYFTDAASNAVYGQGLATPLLTQFAGAGFNFAADLAESRPTGLGIDPAGNLYVLDAAGKRVVEFNPDSPSTAFLVPASRLSSPASMAVASTGNLYLTDEQGLIELIYNGNAINFGTLNVGKKSSTVTLNYSFNGEVAEPKLYQNLLGGKTGAFVVEHDECLSEKITTGFTCRQQVHVNFAKGTSGLQKGMVGLATKADHVLGVVPAATTVQAAVLDFFPGTWSYISETGSNPALLEPQGVVASSDGNSLYVADEGGVLSNDGTYTYSGAVWSYPWPSAGTPTQLGASTFKTPSALAVDSTGTLWVADYTLGAVYSLTGNKLKTVTKLSIPGTAVALNHPIALAFDNNNNMYIGDGGPLGALATASSPGYVVEVPSNGGNAIKVSTTVSGTPVIFPQALAVDAGNNLYVADGGDQINTFGSLVVVPSATGTPAYIPTGSYQLNGPSGLGFDPAMNLYVLDGYNARAFYIPVTLSGNKNRPSFGTIQPFPQALGLDTGAAMYVWPSGQQFTFTDIGEPPSPVTQVETLNTQYASLTFGPIAAGSSQTQTVTVLNVGNQATGLAYSQTGSPNFSDSLSCYYITAGNNCTMSFTYSPTSAGNSSGQFQFYNSYSTNYVNVTGTATKTTPTVTVIPDTHSLTWDAGMNVNSSVNGAPITTVPTGTATLYDLYNGVTTALFTGLLNNGVLYHYISNATLHAGTHTLTTTYFGDGLYNGATSAPQIITVAQAKTNLGLYCFGSYNGGRPGPITCGANISSGTGELPTGNVVYTVIGPNGTTRYTVPLTNANANLNLTNQPVGTYSISASFAAQGDYAASSAGPQTATVQ